MTTHPDPEPFRSRARAHMRQWVASELSVTPTDQVSAILPLTGRTGQELL